MKIKKCLLAATLSAGLVCSSTALAHAADVSPTARVGFIAAYMVTKQLSELVQDAVQVGSTAVGTTAGVLAAVWAGTKIGGSLGAIIGGPAGAIAGGAVGAA